MDGESDLTLLDEEALNKLSKGDLVKYALNVSNLTGLIKALSDKIELLTVRLEKSESETSIVKNTNALLKDHVELLDSRLDRVERLQLQDSQYLRNRQVEIKKIPSSEDDSNLKVKVCELISLTGVQVVPDNIDKCHRLSNNQNVIIEFKERELRDDMLRSRKNLKSKDEDLKRINCTDTMILESLTPVYAMLDFLCRKLKKDGYIAETWFFNGRLWMIEREGFGKENITSIRDLYNCFGSMVDNYLVKH